MRLKIKRGLQSGAARIFFIYLLESYRWRSVFP